MSDLSAILLPVSTNDEREKMRNQLISDDELAGAFAQTLGKKSYQATFIPEDAPYPSVELWDIKNFTANSKPEAVKIAREYGTRFLNKKMIYVYLAPRG